MSVFKCCYPGKSTTVPYCARINLAVSPPPGTIIDPDDPHKEVWKDQFSSGDQTDSSRIAFWNSGFSACVGCGERNVWRFDEKAGVRQDGQVYGTSVFFCKTKGCKWETSFKYDDHCDDCVHFETRGWPRGIMHYTVPFMMMWVDKHNLGSMVKHMIFVNQIDGDKFLQYSMENKLEEFLQVDTKIGQKILEALDDKFGALL